MKEEAAQFVSPEVSAITGGENTVMVAEDEIEALTLVTGILQVAKPWIPPKFRAMDSPSSHRPPPSPATSPAPPWLPRYR